MPVSASPSVRWRALLADGIAHAFRDRRSPALCGAPTQAEAFDYPAKVRCAICLLRIAP